MPSREQLEKLLAAEPDDLFLNFALAMELAKSETKEPALQRFRRVIELEADYSPAYYQQGRLLLTMERPDEPRTVLTAGVQAARRSDDQHAAAEMNDLLELACRGTPEHGSAG